jgi:hypothetical protein
MRIESDEMRRSRVRTEDDQRSLQHDGSFIDSFIHPQLTCKSIVCNLVVVIGLRMDGI